MQKNSVNSRNKLTDIVRDCNNVSLGGVGSVLCIASATGEDESKLEVMSSCRGSFEDIVSSMYSVYKQEDEFRDIINALLVNIVYTSNK